MTEVERLQEEFFDARRQVESYRELFEGDALTFLRTVYNDAGAKPNDRLRAAELALPYEKPKLHVMLSGQDLRGLGDKLKEFRQQARQLQIVPNDDAA
jgi:hypothetical protein